ncbi:MAG: anti-sigma factor [Burkholderiaceae bacterium]
MDTTRSEAGDALSEQQLHALVDARLPLSQRDALKERLEHDPQTARAVQAWKAQREALLRLHAQVLQEPLPPNLAAAAERVAQARDSLDRWWRWGGMAAGLLLAFGLGWTLHGRFEPLQSGTVARAAGSLVPYQARLHEFVHQASVAHMVYAPEKRHPVEVDAAQQEHLVQWLSKRLAHPLKVPNLTAEGYELVGGRLLPGTDGARAQFMFQNAAGERVTLYLGAVAAPTAGKSVGPGAPDPRETAFSFSGDGPVPGFYWVDQGFGYALAGDLPRDQLLAIALAVYQQL